MNPQIKERIEQVRRGEVPLGYSKTRAGLMSNDWKPVRQAKDIFKSHTNKQHGGAFKVLSATQDSGIIPRSEVDIDIKFAEESVAGYKKVDYGNFVISLRSFQGGIEFSEYEGLVSPAYTVLKPIIHIVNGYYKAYFKTVDFIKRLNGAIYGIRDGKQIGFEDFSNIILHFPPTAEQEKIAEILTHCDKIIHLKKQLIEEKRRQKRWLMQNLLNPDSGVRLPGFEWSRWKTETIGSVVEYIVGGGTPSREVEAYYAGSIPWATVKDIGEDFYKAETIEHISEAAIKSSATKLITANSFIISTRMGLGRGFINKVDMAINQDLKALSVKSFINIEFFAYWFKAGDLFKRLGKGSTVKGIDLNTLRAIPIRFPSIAEQTTIANVLSTADREIDLLKQELAEWQIKKKSLMQLLLTGIVRVTV